MHRSFLAIPVLLGLALIPSGCGDRDATAIQGLPTVPGPHGGQALRLPSDLGYVECRLEKTGGDRSIVVYFLGPGAEASMSPPPSNVRLELRTDERIPKLLPLEYRPRPDDPSGGARYSSTPGPYSPEAWSGRLIAVIRGGDVTVPIVLR